MRTPLGRPFTRRPDRSRPRPSPPPKRPRGPWKSGPIPVIGLVGGIGSGKSRVAAFLADKGAQVLDADAVGHALLDQPPTRDPVVERFGGLILDRSGSPDSPPQIDRKKLAAIVFSDDVALRALEALLHPRMRQTFEKAISRAARKQQCAAVVLDAAVLFEAKWHDLCDVIVFVDAPAEVRLARVAASRGWTAEDLAARERAQIPLDTQRARTEFVIENGGDEASLATAVDALWDKLVRRPKNEPPRPSRLPRVEPDPAAGEPS